MAAQAILKYWRKYMKDMTQLLLRARDKMQFCNQHQFLSLIRSIKESDTNLKLDWDAGSGEEWTENYDLDEWFIDLNVIRQEVPEIHWHTSEDAVNVRAFCLNDFYFATV